MRRWIIAARELRLTPAQYARVAYVALGALTLIVLSGAAVRLSGSGLGCPDWPKCYGRAYPPLNSHALIEFSNRMITGPVSIAALAAFVLAFKRVPYRRDLMWLALSLPLGIVAQAVLGGFTVRGNLDYGYVMGHFALSMIIVAAAAALAWRATYEPGERPRSRDRQVVWAVRCLVVVSAITIFAGTAATAAGPHGGGSPGQKINRLSFDGSGTMDFVIHRHAEIGFVFGVLAVAVWWLLRRRDADPLLRRSVTVLCLTMALQGVVGMVQYETQLPTELVWVHVTLACAAWLAALWAGAAAGRLVPQRAVAEAEAAERGELAGIAA
jgi:heme a synthase